MKRTRTKTLPLVAKKSQPKPGHNPFPIYRTYEFSGQDPAVANLLAEVGDSDKQVCEDSGVNRSTLRSWRLQKTRRPKFSTMQATAMALGLEYQLRRITKV